LSQAANPLTKVRRKKEKKKEANRKGEQTQI